MIGDFGEELSDREIIIHEVLSVLFCILCWLLVIIVLNGG